MTSDPTTARGRSSVFQRLPPGTHPASMNRYFRRLQQFGKRFSARRSEGEMPTPKEEPPIDPRAKSQRHGKSTADKWNQ
jgi:hypothetical protein